MLAPHSYGVYFDPWGKIVEHDYYMCAHCNAHRRLKPKETPYATCKSCMQFICGRCYGLIMAGHPCKPLEQWLLEQEKAITAAIERRRAVAEYGP